MSGNFSATQVSKLGVCILKIEHMYTNLCYTHVTCTFTYDMLIQMHMHMRVCYCYVLLFLLFLLLRGSKTPISKPSALGSKPKAIRDANSSD